VRSSETRTIDERCQRASAGSAARHGICTDFAFCACDGANMPGERRSFDEKPAGRAMSIEGVTINLASLAGASATAVRRAERGEGFTLFTLNLDHFVKLGSSAEFRAAYQRADYVTADGWPVVWLARTKGARLERTSGADLVEPLCEAAAARDIGVYFIGPGPRAQAGALDILRRRFQGLRVAGAEAPRLPATPDAAELDALAHRINASGARLCFVSLGAPKQEILADALAARCPATGFLCVGAALDFISGETRRAPAWMRRGKLEWFWRLATDPRRLALRYALCAAVFVRLALRAAFERGGERETATEPAGAGSPP
jgi:exopolysaccharide biosynthesis WecB/TagA/CpsF family protein